MQKIPELNYFNHSQSYFRFILLKKIDEQEGLLLPVQSQDSELLKAISNVQIKKIIEEGLAKKIKNEDTTEILIITEKGKSQLQKDHIDFQLDLLALEQNLGDYFLKKIKMLKDNNLQTIALYGASDTAQSFLNYLKINGFNITCIIDDDEKKQSELFFGFQVISRANASLNKCDAIVITTIEFEDEIKLKINQSFGSKYKVLSLFNNE